MSQPVFQDDTTIGDEERLFRRVPVIQLVPDEDTGLARVSSCAFRDRELSVYIESVLTESGRSAESCLRNYDVHKLVSITAANARQFNQAVCRNPLPEEPSHGLVYGSKNNSKISRGLSSLAAWVIPPAPLRNEELILEKRRLGIEG
jgi:hypothetical protein